jgi:hypothetical protein
MSVREAIVRAMRRRSRSKFPVKPVQHKHPLTPLDAGCCLLGLDHMRELGLACPSDIDVLRFTGIDVEDAEAVGDAKFHFRHKALRCLIDGMVLNPPLPPEPPFPL